MSKGSFVSCCALSNGESRKFVNVSNIMSWATSLSNSVIFPFKSTIRKSFLGGRPELHSLKHLFFYRKALGGGLIFRNARFIQLNHITITSSFLILLPKDLALFEVNQTFVLFLNEFQLHCRLEEHTELTKIYLRCFEFLSTIVKVHPIKDFYLFWKTIILWGGKQKIPLDLSVQLLLTPPYWSF